MWRQLLPVLVVAALALILLAWAFIYSRRKVDKKNEDRVKAEFEWDEECKFDNPRTGAVCERKEFHLENHYHELPDGELVTWR